MDHIFFAAFCLIHPANKNQYYNLKMLDNLLQKNLNALCLFFSSCLTYNYPLITTCMIFWIKIYQNLCLNLCWKAVFVSLFSICYAYILFWTAKCIHVFLISGASYFVTNRNDRILNSKTRHICMLLICCNLNLFNYMLINSN